MFTRKFLLKMMAAGVLVLAGIGAALTHPADELEQAREAGAILGGMFGR